MAKQFGSQLDLQKIPVLGLVIESSDVAPIDPTEGQLWYDTAAVPPVAKVYQDGAWVQLSGAPDGSAPTGAAGGSLAGTYPNPTVAAGVITDAEVAAANKDGLAGVASMRTLGTGAGQALPGNTDLSGLQPGAHAATHDAGGSDALAADAAAATPSLRSLGLTATQAMPGDTVLDGRAPGAHAATHEPGGADALAVDAEAAVGSLRTLGTTATSAAAGNHAHAGMATQDEIDAISIVTVPSTSLSAVQSGTTAGGDLTWTITLDSLTLANTITEPNQPDPNTPLIPGEPGDLYVDTVLGSYWISDGTKWTKIDAPGTGILSVGDGAGVAIDATTPTVPVISVGAGDGIVVGADSVAVQAAPGGNIIVDATGVSVDPAALASQVVAGDGLLDTAGTFDVVAGAGVAVAADVSVLADPAGPIAVGVAGVSLDIDPNTLAITTGLVGAKLDPAGGLVSSASGIALAPTAAPVLKFVSNVAATAGTPVPVAHGLGTANVVVSFVDTDTGKSIGFDWGVTDVDTITVDPAVAYASIDVTVIG